MIKYKNILTLFNFVKNLIKFNFCRFTSRIFVPIIIYQPGRVGSISIYNSIKQIKLNVFHIHRLSIKNFKKISHFNRNAGSSLPSKYYSEKFTKHFIKKNKKIKFIIPIREPISRKLSQIFQTGYLNNNFELNQIKNKNFSESFIKLEEINSIEDWFQNEFNYVFNREISKLNFDKNKGWSKINIDNFSILIFKSEIDNEIKNKIIKEFLNIKQNLNIKNSNSGEHRHYSEHYKMIRNNLKLPKNYLTEIYSGKVVNLFYTSDEIENFIKRWS